MQATNQELYRSGHSSAASHVLAAIGQVAASPDLDDAGRQEVLVSLAQGAADRYTSPDTLGTHSANISAIITAHLGREDGLLLRPVAEAMGLIVARGEAKNAQNPTLRLDGLLTSLRLSVSTQQKLIGEALEFAASNGGTFGGLDAAHFIPLLQRSASLAATEPHHEDSLHDRLARADRAAAVNHERRGSVKNLNI